MITKGHVLLALSIGMMAACQRAEDPAQAGFLDGLLNQVDGTYDERLSAKQQERRNLEAVNAALADQIQVLRDQQTNNAERLAATERQLNATDRRIAALRARYASAEEQYPDELATLDEVKAEVDQQRLILAAATDGDVVQDQVIDQSVRRVEELSRIVDLMPE
jgi:chromosome segregation ATPase